MIGLRIKRLALAAVIFAFVVIALGAITRLSDAGLGCPDWPGCYGHLTVPTSVKTVNQIDHLFPQHPIVAHKAWAEMIHRYCAGTLSLLIAAVVFFAIREAKRLKSKKRMTLAIALLLLLLYQPILGMWTVTWKLLPIVVSQHLLGGFGLLAMLWAHYCLYARSRNNNTGSRITPAAQAVRDDKAGAHVISASGAVIPAPEPGSSNNNTGSRIKSGMTEVKSGMTEVKSGMTRLAIIALVLVIFQITLGAWTSTNYAAISCATFPFCQIEPWHLDFRHAFSLMSSIGANYDGGLLSDDARRTIQMVHRVGAMVVTLYLFLFAGLVAWKNQQNPRAIKLVLFMVTFLLLQICLGIANVMLARPLLIAVLHNLTAASLLLSVVTINIFVLSQRDEPIKVGEMSYA
ncbi:MAG: COX15/CtaA family protein [Coxiellaceae bacterium]|nr:COX15/CtaA family protein [Coxiellaceae bacterium]